MLVNRVCRKPMRLPQFYACMWLSLRYSLYRQRKNACIPDNREDREVRVQTLRDGPRGLQGLMRVRSFASTNDHDVHKP